MDFEAHTRISAREANTGSKTIDAGLFDENKRKSKMHKNNLKYNDAIDIDFGLYKN